MAAFTTMAIIAGISTAVSAVQQVRAGRAAKKAGQEQATAATQQGIAAQESSESEAQLSDFNQEVANLQAQDAIARGAEEAGKFRSQVRGAIGAQRAGIAANNIDVGYGSAVDVQADTAYLGELDALAIETNAKREAWGHQVQAADFGQRAVIARKEGSYRRLSGAAAADAARAQGSAMATQNYLGAVNSGLSTASSLVGLRYQMSLAKR